MRAPTGNIGNRCAAAVSTLGVVGEWAEILQVPPALSYRTVRCDSRGNTPMAWRLRTASDRQEVHQETVSGPGAPGFLYVPPDGGVVYGARTSDPPGSSLNPYTLRSEDNPGLYQAYVVESDGLLDATIPPIIAWFKTNHALGVGTHAINIPLPTGYYTLDRCQIDVVSGTLSTISLMGLTGMPYIGDPTASPALHIPAGSPIIAKLVVTLDVVVTAAAVLSAAILFRRDPHQYVEHPTPFSS